MRATIQKYPAKRLLIPNVLNLWRWQINEPTIYGYEIQIQHHQIWNICVMCSWIWKRLNRNNKRLIPKENNYNNTANEHNSATIVQSLLIFKNLCYKKQETAMPSFCVLIIITSKQNYYSLQISKRITNKKTENVTQNQFSPLPHNYY